MRKFGLVGFPLEHSFSKKFFEEKFKREQLTDVSYELFPLPSIESFLPLISSEVLLSGLNVTIPYKEAVIKFLNELDPAAKAIGAVNCIKIANGYMKGYNTDAPAFKQSLQQFLKSSPLQTFVLGTGGSSKAVCFVLEEMKLPYLCVSRQAANGNIGYNEVLKNMKPGNLLVNTTPLGMFPATGNFPDIPYTELTENDFLFDLVYNPEETEFLKLGKQKGAHTQNGQEMLHLQAEKSWDIWNSNG